MGLNPLKIGSVCNNYNKDNMPKNKRVSIPLRSGLFVIMWGDKRVVNLEVVSQSP